MRRGNEDLTIAKLEGRHLLAKARRIGERVRSIPLYEHRSLFVLKEIQRREVVSLARRFVV